MSVSMQEVKGAIAKAVARRRRRIANMRQTSTAHI